jgi:hypothetical protein
MAYLSGQGLTSPLSITRVLQKTYRTDAGKRILKNVTIVRIHVRILSSVAGIYPLFVIPKLMSLSVEPND